MKYFSLAVAVAILAAGSSYGQETHSNYEHLKCYDQLIGTWESEGPALEDLPEFAQKGESVTSRVSYQWILDKNIVQVTYHAESKSGGKFTIMSMIGWDRADKRIFGVGANSFGGHSTSIETYDDATKTWTSHRNGVNSKGNKTSATGVLTLQDQDTYVGQNLARKGGVHEGDGPKVVYKRVKAPKQP